jgi:hypothetical protein
MVIPAFKEMPDWACREVQKLQKKQIRDRGKAIIRIIKNTDLDALLAYFAVKAAIWAENYVRC